jgi:MoxR-like ATPase
VYTELIKIIEAGLAGDSVRVGRYARQLAQNLEQAGDTRAARRVRRSIERGPGGGVHLNRLSSAPVDQETRMEIADLYTPMEADLGHVVVPVAIAPALEAFTARVKGRPALEQAGVATRTSLLLHGPPGSGKTTLANWVTHEIGLPLVVGRLDALVSSMLGGTSRNIRRLFDFAGQQPCVLFLDELDAVAKTRDDPHEMGELKRGVNSLLQNIDAFLDEAGVLVAATNHPALLDSAVWRRFTTVVEVGYPSEDGLRALVRRHVPTGVSALSDRDERKLATALAGLSPSDVQAVLHGAAARAVLDGGRDLTLVDVLVELHRLRRPEGAGADEVIAFLSEQGASQRAIASALGVSGRQVRNALSSA